MTTEYTPTTEEIREYVEVGGEPRPWMPPTPEQDEARVAAFDRWLAEHDATQRREVIRSLIASAKRGEWTGPMDLESFITEEGRDA